MTMTDLGRHAPAVAALAGDVASLTRVVQGLFLHERWAQRYGVEHSPEELEAVHLRRAEDLLDAALQRDGRPLDVAREPAGRLPAMCRNLSVVLVAMLRAHGIEARARAGFATYFIPGWYEDHWVVELGDGRWVDPQIDDVQRAALGITFDPLDMPAGAFVPGPDAWRLLRGGADPASFGLSGSGLAGEWFVAGDVLYDLAAVGGVETLPWDTWDPMPGPDDEVDVALFDAYAEGRAAPPPVPAKVLNTRRGRVEELHQIA